MREGEKNTHLAFVFIVLVPCVAMCEVGLGVSQKDMGLEEACDTKQTAQTLQCNGLKNK